MMGWLDTEIWNYPVRELLVAVGTAAGLWLVAMLAKRLVLGRLRVLAERTATELDDAVVAILASTKSGFLLLIAAYAGARTLEDWRGVEVARAVAVIAALAQCALYVNGLVSFYVARHRERHLETDAASVTTVAAVGVVGRVVVWTIAFLLALDNLGFDVTALMAGLGVGGIAVALALQNVLGDLFASLSIVIDKPFNVGDFLEIGTGQLGTVEKVGLKTTRLRSLGGEQLIVANSDLLTSRIRNFKRMQERRIVFRIGVVYDTPPAKLRRVPDVIKGAIEDAEPTRFDRAHFAAFADHSLLFEAVYFVLDRDYGVFMDVQQEINFRILERLADEGIEFAYPTQRLLVEPDERTSELLTRVAGS